VRYLLSPPPFFFFSFFFRSGSQIANDAAARFRARRCTPFPPPFFFSFNPSPPRTRRSRRSAQLFAPPGLSPFSSSLFFGDLRQSQSRPVCRTGPPLFPFFSDTNRTGVGSKASRPPLWFPLFPFPFFSFLAQPRLKAT